MIRLAIAEDHQSLIDGLQLQLQYSEEIQIVGSCNDGEALLELVEKKVPDTIITDIRMPKMDGISATKILKEKYPDMKILAFTMYNQPDAVIQMLEAGASGYILKNSSLEEVIEAIKTVSKGEKYYDANLDVNLLNEAENSKKKKGVLTKRQQEILTLVAQGKTNREIANQLFIGVYTVETHRKNMIKILGLHGNGELLRYALEQKYNFES